MPDPTRETISATETPALFGASPYLTRWMLYQRIAKGVSIDSEADNRMEMGTRLEPALLKIAAEDHRLEVIANRGDDGKQIYVRRGLLGCTRDATIIDPQRGPLALEIKCAFDYRVWMESWGGGKSPPRHNELQLQQQMYVGDGEKPFAAGVLGCFVGGEMKYWKREPMPRLWSQFETEATKFFDDVKEGREPSPFGDPVEMPLMAELFPTAATTVLDLTEHADAERITQDVLQLNYHNEERLGHERAEKALKAKLTAVIGTAEEALLLHGVKFTRKQSPRAGYTVKPSTQTRVDWYIPNDVPRGDIVKDFANADLGG